MKSIHIFLTLTLLFSFQLVFSQNSADSVLINGQEPTQSVESKNKKAIKAGKEKKKNKFKSLKSDSVATDSITTIVKADSTLSDSSLAAADSSNLFVADSSLYKIGGDDVKEPIEYKAVDSIVYMVEDGVLKLYHQADLQYQDIKLQAEYVTYDWNTNILSAIGKEDSTGKLTGKPVFDQGGSQYNSREVRYNFKSQKGKVYDVLTEEGGGYIHSEEVAKNEYDEWYGKNAKYTTCEHEDPHFYINANKVKVIPNKLLITGPANLVIADVPTPLYLPFGIFPVQQGRRSGIIFPQYGESTGSQGLGFYLREGGYYWAINDNLAAAITGDIYTKGSWGSRLNLRYNKRYVHNGNFNFSYFRRRSADPDLPTAIPSANEFRVGWSYSQDAKAKPNSTFSANVNAETTTYRSSSFVTDQSRLNTLLTSAIRYSKRWKGQPFNLTLNLNHSQNLRTRIVSVDFPVVNFSVSRVNPFRPKVSTGKKKWYEGIGFTYQFEAKNSVSTIDSLFFSKDIFSKMKYGMKHEPRINASFPILKYFTLSPSFNYTERWYFQTINKTWNPDTLFVLQSDTTIDTIFGQIETDTLRGFSPARDFVTSVSFSTKIFGIYNFKSKKIKALRHVITPVIGFSYRPDFGAERWDYYDEVQSNADGDVQRYSHFDIVSSLYGRPPEGRSGTLSFNLNNNFEMKVASKNDTVVSEKKVGILDRLSFSTNYNFAADSIKLAPLRIDGTTTIGSNFSIRFGVLLDPYIVDSNFRKLDTYVWSDRRRLYRFVNTNFALDYSLSSNKVKSKKEPTAGTEEEREFVTSNLDQYYDFNNPWSFRIGYNFNLRKGQAGNIDTLLVSANSVTLDMDFNLTKNWKFDFQTGFDIRMKQLQRTSVGVIRNLHCWELSFNWVAFPKSLQNYNIQIRVKSAVLQELKLAKRSAPQGGFF